MTTTENKRCVGGAFIKAVGADRPRFQRYFSADESTWIDVAVAAVTTPAATTRKRVQ